MSPGTTGTDEPPGITALSFFPSLTPPASSSKVLNGVPNGISKLPGLFTWPDTEKHLKPALSLVPKELNQSGPLLIIFGIEAKVSTLFIIVGEPKSPLTAGNGGLYLGKPFLPSIDSSIAVSSPTIYAPAPIKSWISILTFVFKIFFPISLFSYASFNASLTLL